jgi:membrane protease YdiL (CAAX protease family)
MSQAAAIAYRGVMSLPDTSRVPAAGPATEAHASPETSVTYDHALYGTGGKWRGVVAIVVFVLAYLLVSLVLGVVAVGIDLATGVSSLDDLAAGVISITPMVFLANNLSLAALIPLAMLMQRWFFGVKARWIFSVTGGLRWRWLGRLALVIVPVWIVYVGASFLLDPGGELSIDGTALAFIAIIVLTTPLQAAGEELGARGLIQRSAGSWLRNPTAAFVVSTIIASALFALAHLAADPWLVAYYFTFAVAASIAARGTGGLEAPILIHVVNNVLLLVPAVVLGQLAEGFDRSAGTGGPFMLVPMAICLAAAFFSAWWARRNGVATRAPRPPKVVRAQAAPPVQVEVPPAV